VRRARGSVWARRRSMVSCSRSGRRERIHGRIRLRVWRRFFQAFCTDRLRAQRYTGERLWRRYPSWRCGGAAGGYLPLTACRCCLYLGILRRIFALPTAYPAPSGLPSLAQRGWCSTRGSCAAAFCHVSGDSIFWLRIGGWYYLRFADYLQFSFCFISRHHLSHTGLRLSNRVLPTLAT